MWGRRRLLGEALVYGAFLAGVRRRPVSFTAECSRGWIVLGDLAGHPRCKRTLAVHENRRAARLPQDITTALDAEGCPCRPASSTNTWQHVLFQLRHSTLLHCVEFSSGDFFTFFALALGPSSRFHVLNWISSEICVSLHEQQRRIGKGDSCKEKKGGCLLGWS